MYIHQLWWLEIKGYKLYNFINEYVIINHDVIFYESNIFNWKQLFQVWIMD
jgi:hypothetical protein